MASKEEIDQLRLLVRGELALMNSESSKEACPRMPVRKPTAIPKPLLMRLEDKIPKLVTVLKNSRSRIRSASAGRDRKSDLQARYWGLLFENLRRAVDEIYLTCEMDESVEECKEAIMILESCTKDFRNLIEWLRLKWNYEQTPPPQRPNSLAWEVRKSSPSKPSCAAIMGQLQKTSSGLARRMLNFEATHSTSCSSSSVGTKEIVTISEAVETSASESPETSVRSPSKVDTSQSIKKLDVKAVTKSNELTSTPRDLRKPWRVGKAGKNAVNSEVQSQSWAQRVIQTPTVSKVAWSSATKCQTVKSQAVSSSQRTQPATLLPKFDFSQPQSKSRVVKTETLPKIPKTSPRGTKTVTDKEDGWETVRGRTRSRTSPIKKTPPTLTRASTMICTSKSTNRPDSQRQRLGQLKPSATQSLPSLCDELIAVTELAPVPPLQAAAPAASAAPAAPAAPVSEEEADQLVEEEAEMARREEALAKEEENLQRELRETERSDNEADEWEEPINVTPVSTPEGDVKDVSQRPLIERDVLEDKYQLLLENCSWGEQMDLLDQLQEVAAMDARQPGRALQVHEKLSSPSRRRLAEPCEAFQQHEAKQLRAQQHRAALQEEKSRKRRDLAKRMDEVRTAKNLLVDQRKQLLERKMKQAEEKRMKHLAEIVKKAHDEEEKKKEIAFINVLEAQIKRHDFITHIQTQEERIQGLQEERQRRQEERKQAKEAAVEERKRALEAERQAKMAQLQEKRRQREERIDREQQEKEKERLELAREKQRDREERLSALQAAHEASLKDLQMKIQQKQEESARRHEENIEQIRQKALELSILRFSSAGDDAPRLVQYDTERVCSLCNVVINTEVLLMSHLRGKRHMEALRNHFDGKEPSREQSESSNLKFIRTGIDGMPTLESEKEKRAKLLKKRAKKLKTKMASTPEASAPAFHLPPGRHRIVRIIQDLERDPSAFERHWNELIRLLEKGSATEQLILSSQRGLPVVTNFLNAWMDGGSPVSSIRLVASALNVVRLAARCNPQTSAYIVNSRVAPLLLCLLTQRLECLGNSMNRGGQAQPMSDTVATTAMNTWVAVADALVSGQDAHPSHQEFVNRLQHLISYAVSLGLVDRLAVHVGNVRGPLDDHSTSANELLLSALKFLTSLINLLYLCQTASAKQWPKKKFVDSTQLIEAFQVTELAGTVNALYGLLLHQGVPSGGRPAQLMEDTVRFAKAALCLLHRLALLDLKAFQNILGAEGVSLEFRHIASFLLSYGVDWSSESHLLHLTILTIGYFATGHHDNQMILQSGHMPSVLQQLCRLPFNYFSDKTLQAVLFPTLVACCHGSPSNQSILTKEMSYQMLDDFVKSEEGQAVHLVQVVFDAKH